mmetsp:Transcript_50865/g.58803  ORF Transcript_50865/g.58803 Transcript_50865/m.58803 type:complete len:118 (+) Transcript_50865:43-396(+)|eukprot:CAMPEP_0170758072 /NCGR_PEP_ID=MMETSP0733-20121128/106_1 /TAXON_ID=186038 /ORGANISM="Fragilariopsis kerguelensis, Strain L26-C5" /LENGTH=117 /DNA_ID=CAMNT_0011097291 /DNA_START=29 /DNA_END=382 /DNA_ORIENTATION=-
MTMGGSDNNVVAFSSSESVDISRSNENIATTASSKSADIPLLQAANPNEKLPTIKLGESIRFEEWGPIILNSDGTTRRITNWENLTDHEKEVTWRRISKRNEKRRNFLLDQQEKVEE